MKKILFISYDGMTDPLGQSQVIPYIMGLSKEGFKFHILSCEKKNNFEKNKKYISNLLNEAGIAWYPVPYSKSPPVLSTLWDLLLLKRKAIRLHKKENFSLVHCRSYIPSLIGLTLKKKYGIKFVFDMRGFWADERVDGNLWDTKKYVFKRIYSYFKKKEKEFLSNSDHIISLTERGKKEILSWNINDVTDDKISVIPCSADENIFTLKTKELQTAAKKKIEVAPETFIISYMGSLGTWYLLDEMILFFSALKSTKPNAKFLFLTPDNKDLIYRSAKKYNLDPSDFIIFFAKRSEIINYAHAADISIFFIKPSYSKISSSPTKMGELLLMGIPVITNGNIGDIEKVLDGTKSGVIVNNFNKSAFENIIPQIDKLLNLPPSEIRNNSVSYFRLSKGIDSYLSVYNKLIP